MQYEVPIGGETVIEEVGGPFEYFLTPFNTYAIKYPHEVGRGQAFVSIKMGKIVSREIEVHDSEGAIHILGISGDKKTAIFEYKGLKAGDD
jgi:hypothetical protein